MVLGLRAFSSRVIGPVVRESPAEKWVRSLTAGSVPLKMFSVRYDRSSGPGGQKVNKTSSKCTLVLYNFSSCSWMPEEVRLQLRQKPIRYYAKNSDSLVVQADEERSRELNRQLCLEKLVREIKKCCWFPKETGLETVEKWKAIKARAKEGRLKEKKQHSDKKRLRNKSDFT